VRRFLSNYFDLLFTFVISDGEICILQRRIYILGETQLLKCGPNRDSSRQVWHSSPNYFTAWLCAFVVRATPSVMICDHAVCSDIAIQCTRIMYSLYAISTTYGASVVLETSVLSWGDLWSFRPIVSETVESSTSATLNHHPRVAMHGNAAVFRNRLSFWPHLACCRQNFRMISETAQELSRWQRNKHRRTLLKTYKLTTLSLSGWYIWSSYY